jgi:hypothetical protein
MSETESRKTPPLDVRVDQLLTEARVIIPAAQALLGFQMAVTLTRAFAQLPSEAKMAHAAALCCVGLGTILLMAPASLHGIAFAGQDDADFVKMAPGSSLPPRSRWLSALRSMPMWRHSAPSTRPWSL